MSKVQPIKAKPTIQFTVQKDYEYKDLYLKKGDSIKCTPTEKTEPKQVDSLIIKEIIFSHE